MSQDFLILVLWHEVGGRLLDHRLHPSKHKVEHSIFLESTKIATCKPRMLCQNIAVTRLYYTFSLIQPILQALLKRPSYKDTPIGIEAPWQPNEINEEAKERLLATRDIRFHIGKTKNARA